MRMRRLGKTGLDVSEVGFGCWAIGGNAYGKVDDRESLEALETAWSGGVNFFDTADTYGEGHSESLLAKFLKGKPRDQVLIATKAGWDFYPEDLKQCCATADSRPRNLVGHRKNFDSDYLRFACEQSLERLGVDHIDLYQLHNPTLEQIRSGDPVSALETLKREGKIRAIGISVHREEEALAAIEDPRVESLQVIFNILDQRMAEHVFAEAEKRNVGMIAREPLASGLLTGKYPPGHEFPKTDHRRRWSSEKREWDWQKVQVIRHVLGNLLAVGDSGRAAQAALEFVLSFPAITSVIPGAKTKTQVLNHQDAVSAPFLSESDRTRLRALWMDNPLFRKGLLPR
jgi:aryl-alcohol dehydrogenase-like predicted oxidoreductase